jgi:mono/diheme cytochrome c family protein
MKKFWLGVVCALAAEAIAAGIALFGGFLPVTADMPAGGFEKAVLSAALSRGVRRGAQRLTNPLTVTDSTLVAGLNTYKANCASCHGAPDLEQSTYGKSFLPTVPQFAEQPPHRSEAELYYIIRHGIRMTGMASWEKQMEDKQLWQVAAFLSRLNSLPPAVEEKWKRPKTD